MGLAVYKMTGTNDIDVGGESLDERQGQFVSANVLARRRGRLFCRKRRPDIPAHCRSYQQCEFRRRLDQRLNKGGRTASAPVSRSN